MCCIAIGKVQPLGVDATLVTSGPKSSYRRRFTAARSRSNEDKPTKMMMCAFCSDGRAVQLVTLSKIQRAYETRSLRD